MIAPTRRGLLAGAAAALAAPAVARGQAAPVAPRRARQVTVRRGRAIAVGRDGRRVMVAHEASRTVAVVSGGRTRLIDVGGQPLEVAVSPDGRLAAVTTAFWDEPGLAVVNLASGAVRRVKAGPAPLGVAFTPDSERLVVSGGEQEGTLEVFEVGPLRSVARAHVGTVPRGVAIEASGRAAWVAITGRDHVVRVDLRSGRVRRTLPTPALPERLALAPDGRRLLVTHGGPGAEHVSELDLRSRRVERHRVGHRPAAVAWTRKGRRLVVLAGSGELVALPARRTGRRTRRRLGGLPRGLAVAGGRAYTVDGLTGAINRVRI